MAESTETTRTTGSAARRQTTQTARKTTQTKRAATTKRNQAKTQTRATKRTATRATARTQTAAAREAAEARKEAVSVVERLGDVAERTVLTGVGATLTARDNILDLVETYSDRTKFQRRLKGFERRGTTARNRLERELKKRRTRVERELRQRTARVERDVRSLRADAERFGRELGRDLEKSSVAQQLGLGRAAATNVASGVALGATKAAREVTERVASVVS
jgi:hypothetical protein